MSKVDLTLEKVSTTESRSVSPEYYDSPLFVQAKQEAIVLMSPVHDPLHDEQHVLEVATTVQDIAASLDVEERKCVDLEALELAALYHDTSRTKIGSNLLSVPFLDEKYSGDIAYNSLVRIGYAPERASEVKRIIRGNAKVGGIGRNNDVNSQLLSDADKVQVYNPQRFERGYSALRRVSFPGIF